MVLQPSYGNKYLASQVDNRSIATHVKYSGYDEHLCLLSSHLIRAEWAEWRSFSNHCKQASTQIWTKEICNTVQLWEHRTSWQKWQNPIERQSNQEVTLDGNQWIVLSTFIKLATFRTVSSICSALEGQLNRELFCKGLLHLDESGEFHLQPWLETNRAEPSAGQW